MRRRRLYHGRLGVKTVDRLRLTAVYEQDDGWIHARVLEIRPLQALEIDLE